MTNALAEIRSLLLADAFKNEEHVRVGIVARLLDALGWNVWDPSEVFYEFIPVPAEDRTRVDVALLTGDVPWAFIEVKALGLLSPNIDTIEAQMRDYNRNLTAMFSIATDGKAWRFYYSQTSGDFRQKLFKCLDLMDDDLNDVETTLTTFLSKEGVQDGNAEREAKEYLKFNRKQRAMDDAMTQAKRAITEPPFPSLPEAIVSIVGSKGHDVTKDEAADFIKRYQPIVERLVEVRQPTSFYTEMLRRRPHRAAPVSEGNEALTQILDVCKLMYKGHEWTEAVKLIAKDRNVHVGTIRDKCTRQLALNTDGFLLLSRNRVELKARLNERFPGNSAFIEKELG